MTGRLTILHTNDLHGRLTPALATRLAELKEACRPSLLLDSGDAVACGNVGWHRAGEPAHELMNQAGYDAGALGNREFHFLEPPQRCKLQRAAFPILSANLSEPLGYGGVQRFVDFAPGGLPIRVIGLTVPMVTAKMVARYFSRARFVPAAEVLPELLPDDGRPVVVLSHLGLSRDRQLAAGVPGLLAILGGHSHTGLPEPERHDATLVLQNAPYAASLSRLVIEFGDAGASIVDARCERLTEERRNG